MAEEQEARMAKCKAGEAVRSLPPIEAFRASSTIYECPHGESPGESKIIKGDSDD